jgi:amino acid permease
LSKKLSTFEAACIVAGNGIGGGLMALPFLAQHTGWLGTLVILTCAWVITVILHLMVADMLIAAKNGNGILSVFNEFLFRGKLKKILTAAFFLLLLITLLFNLSAYITGGADIITDLLGLPSAFSKILTYLIAIIVPIFGLKALGLSEKATVILMILAALSLTVISFIKGNNTLEILPKNINSVIALYGLAMFSFSALFSVPQAVEGLTGDTKAIKKAIISGVGINLVMSLFICYSSLYASETVTEVAIVGWSNALGLPVKILGSILILFAMLTSFWAISHALSDMVCEQFKFKRGKWLVFICSTVSCLLLSLFSGATFTSFIGIAGGAVAVIIALLLLPAYRVAVKGELWLIMVIGFFYILMAVGAVITAV